MTATFQTMTVTDHERNEWARFAQAAYNVYRSDIGHRFSMAATRRTMPLAEFDRLQADYRAWLVFNELPARVESAERCAVCCETGAVFGSMGLRHRFGPTDHEFTPTR